MNVGYDGYDLHGVLNDFSYYFEYETIKDIFKYLRKDVETCFDISQNRNVIPSIMVIYLIILKIILNMSINIQLI